MKHRKRYAWVYDGDPEDFEKAIELNQVPAHVRPVPPDQIPEDFKTRIIRDLRDERDLLKAQVGQAASSLVEIRRLAGDCIQNRKLNLRIHTMKAEASRGLAPVNPNVPPSLAKAWFDFKEAARRLVRAAWKGER